MNINRVLLVIGLMAALWGCTTKQPAVPLVGTWQLVAAETIEKDSSFSTFNPKQKMIKIINPTHFAFLNHSIGGGQDSTTEFTATEFTATQFTAGGGTYTLKDSVYTENLEYFVDKKWENNQFNFVVHITNDTLVQKGVEKVAKLGIDHIIIEKYKRVSN